MATYAIGDVQGCYRELRELLDHIRFDPGRDRLWLVGDLVNRGPDSLSVLRFVHELGPVAVSILGNHDLHLLACAWGDRRLRGQDTLEPILAAPDREPLLHWLCQRPLWHHDAVPGVAMVHAGLPPQWTVAAAQRHAQEVESVLRSDGRAEFLRHMYGDEPDCWSDDLNGWARLRFITNCLTRMRFCSRNGRLDLKQKGPPGTQPGKLLPWFAVPGRASRDTRILFGHWATLPVASPDTRSHNVVGLDTGCVWGGRLSALRLDDGTLFSVPSQTHATADN
ncbi:MAG: symmetrical bis(5'-nucleosyl)-tetraphosphatase [Chromatiales bacterium]